MSALITIEQEQTTALTTTEQTRLDELEGTIRAGLETFYAVGNALAEIRESRLYRQTHGTFEDYARQQWGMSKTHANRLIGAAEVVASLPPELPPPTNEGQARELAAIADPVERAEVWGAVVEAGKPTAAAIEREAEALARQVEDLALFEALHTAYSADIISSGRIRKPIEWDGKLWVGTGGMLNGGGGTGYQNGQRVHLASEWQGATYTYEEKRAALAPRQAFSYAGVRVAQGKREYVIGAERVTAHKPKQELSPDQPALIDLVAVMDRYSAIGWALEGERAPWTAFTNRSDRDSCRVELRSWAEVTSTIDAWEEEERKRKGNLQWYGGSVPPPPPPAPSPALPELPPELAGWRWSMNGSKYLLQGPPPQDWATNAYHTPDQAIAEAARRVRVLPRTAKTKDAADELKASGWQLWADAEGLHARRGTHTASGRTWAQVAEHVRIFDESAQLAPTIELPEPPAGWQWEQTDSGLVRLTHGKHASAWVERTNEEMLQQVIAHCERQNRVLGGGRPTLPNGWTWDEDASGKRPRYRATKGSWSTGWYQSAGDVLEELGELQEEIEDGAISTHAVEDEELADLATSAAPIGVSNKGMSSFVALSPLALTNVRARMRTGEALDMAINRLLEAL